MDREERVGEGVPGLGRIVAAPLALAPEPVGLEGSALGAVPEIRVHRVIARMNVGGPALHVTNLAQALEGRCRTTLVVGAAGPGERDMTDHARQRGIDVRVVPSLGPELRAGRDLRAFAALVRLFRRERPHVVHSHTAKAGALARVAAAVAGVPVRIHTFHGHVLGGHYFSPGRTRFFIELERQLARLSQRIVVLSAAQREELSTHLGVASDRTFRVIPLGLDLARFRRLDPSMRGPAKEALGLPATCVLLGAVGRLVPIKRHDLLLHVLAQLVRSGDEDWRLAVAGGGPERERLEAMARRLSIADRVTWLGWLEDVTPLLEATDVLVQSSDDEGTPVSVMEAVAAGVPVVATRVGGLADMVSEGTGIRLTPRGDAGALSNAVRRLIAEGEGVPSLTRDAFVERYSVDRLAEDTWDLYRTELDRAGIECGSGAPTI